MSNGREWWIYCNMLTLGLTEVSKQNALEVQEMTHNLGLLRMRSLSGSDKGRPLRQCRKAQQRQLFEDPEWGLLRHLSRCYSVKRMQQEIFKQGNNRIRSIFVKVQSFILHYFAFSPILSLLSPQAVLCIFILSHPGNYPLVQVFSLLSALEIILPHQLGLPRLSVRQKIQSHDPSPGYLKLTRNRNKHTNNLVVCYKPFFLVLPEWKVKLNSYWLLPF